MQQMRHGTMLDADRRPDETPPATGGHADGARPAGPQWAGTRTARTARRPATGRCLTVSYASSRPSQSRCAATAARDTAACGTAPAKPWKPPGHTCSSAEPPACQIRLA
jgi:hypothetical protein